MHSLIKLHNSEAGRLVSKDLYYEYIPQKETNFTTLVITVNSSTLNAPILLPTVSHASAASKNLI